MPAAYNASSASPEIRFMSAPTPPRRRSWFRRHLFPAAVLLFVVLFWVGFYALMQVEDAVDVVQPIGKAFPFLFLGALVSLVVWFLFFSGYSRGFKAVSFGLAAVVLIAAFTSIRTIEFDGNFAMTPRFRWEPTADELLAKHLAAASPAVGGADLTIGTTDSPQFRGPKGDGKVAGVSLAEWASPPRELWRHPVGTGHAGIAVAGNSAVTMEQREGDEVIVCYDRATGHERWAHRYPARFSHTEPMGGDGPRTTPVVVDGSVVTLGATGELVCLDAATGKPRWNVNILTDNEAVNVEWATSRSPVVWNNLVIVTPGVDPAKNAGKAVAAYDLKTGKKAWAGGKHQAAYASPQVVKLAGKEQVLVFDAVGLGGYDPTTGAELWRHPWKSPMDMNSAQPVVVGADTLFVSSEQSNGGALIEVRKSGSEFTTRVVWKTRALAARYACPVVHDGHIYGLSGGRLTCLNAADGKTVWSEGNYGNGQIVLAGDAFVVTAESGKVALVAADSAEYRELGNVPVFKDRTWNMPAVAGNQLFVRNHREMACLELPTKK